MERIKLCTLGFVDVNIRRFNFSWFCEISFCLIMKKINRSVLELMADDPADAVQLRIKSLLMNAIIDHIDKCELTQAAAAEIMLVQRTRVNDVCNGRIDKMTIDALVAMAARLGLDPLKTAA